MLDEILDAIDRDDIGYLSSVDFDVNARVEWCDNDTVFLYAMGMETFTHFDFLLQKKPDLFAINDIGENVIHSIVFSDDPERLEFVLTACPQLQNLMEAKNKEGATPLSLAMLLDKHRVASSLIGCGADVNACDALGCEPLHWACYTGNLALVRKLIAHGANVFKKDNNGNCPLAMAANEDKREVVKCLVENCY